MNRLFLPAVIVIGSFGCEHGDFRNGHSPGDVETTGSATVYHLADGVFVEQADNGRKRYYLIESNVAEYTITPTGLDVELRGENAGSYSTSAAPDGYVAAWMTLVPGDGVEVTRFQIEAATLLDSLQDFKTTTVRDIYNLKK